MPDLADALDRATSATVDALVGNLPQFAGALALLVLGWLLAALLRTLTRRGAALLETLIPQRGEQPRWQPGRTAQVLGTIVFWVVLLFFVTAATQTLGLRTFTDWLARLLDHVPALAAGALIVVAGYILSGFVGNLVRATATALAAPQRAAAARLAQGATLVAALLIGADQMGLKVTWVAILAAIAIATVLGAAALAISLGARGYVANLIGAFYLRQTLQPGQRVRVDGHEGRIVDITATSLVLETGDGRVLLPARIYHDEAIVVVARSESP